MKEKILNKNFLSVIIGQVASTLGSSILRFALNLYVLDITGRADVFAMVLALSAIPGIIFSPIGGAIADRVNRRNLMVILDVGNALTVLLLIFLHSVGAANVVVISLILAMLSVLSSMEQPTVQASLPLLVDEENLASANGIVNGAGAISGIVGPLLGGLLYAFIGIRTLMILSCVAFIMAALLELFIRIPFVKKVRSGNMTATFMSDMKSGMHYITKKDPNILRIIVIAAALNLFMSPFLVIGVPYVLRVTMNSSEMMFGVGMGIAELSTIVGAIMAGSLSKRLKLTTLHRVLFLSALFILPMAVAVTPNILHLGYWPSFTVFFFFAALIMVLMTVISIFVITSVQMKTPNEMLGKVMAIIMSVSQCAAPLGQAIYGILFEKFSHQVYLTVLIAFAFTIAIAIMTKKTLNKTVVQTLDEETPYGIEYQND